MRARAARPDSAEKTVRDIRRATRRQYSAEEKIRIVLEGLRGEASIAELCRKEGIAQSMYYGWSKEFLEAGKRRLPGQYCVFGGDANPSATPVGIASSRARSLPQRDRVVGETRAM